jgi:hypothetical protein
MGQQNSSLHQGSLTDGPWVACDPSVNSVQQVEVSVCSPTHALTLSFSLREATNLVGKLNKKCLPNIPCNFSVYTKHS